jgi:hypothetical protein
MAGSKIHLFYSAFRRKNPAAGLARLTVLEHG